MKNKTLIHFLIAGLTCLSSQAFAQLPSIDSMKLIPANPTSNDVLKVICYTTFSSGSCSLNSIETQQIGNDIYLNLDYTVGMAMYTCSSVDTIEIDNPGAGDYLLTTVIGTNEEDIIEDMDTLQFHIDPYLGLEELHSNTFTIYPNPVQNELTFNANFKAEKLEIHSVSGQKIHSAELLSETPNIDVSALEQGVYFVTLIDPKGNMVTQRIIKNH